MIDDIAKDPEPVSFVRGLIEKYAPDAPDFEIESPWGDKMRFRVVTDLTEINAMKRGARQFAEMVSGKRCPVEWHPYVTHDIEVLGAAYALAELSVDPKITKLEALMLAKEAGPVVSFLQQAVDTRQMRAGFMSVRDIDEKKSELEKTSDLETGSPLPETPGENTLTS